MQFLLRADCGTHFRSAEFLQRTLLCPETADLRVSVHFDAEEHGKGECDGRFSVIRRFFETYAKEKGVGWKWGDQNNIAQHMVDAIKQGTLRNNRDNAIPILYNPDEHGLPPTIYAPIHNVKSSFCFRAGWEGGTRRIFNSVFSQYEIGIPVRIKEPKRIAGPSPQQGTALRNVGFKRVITDSMRNRGRKNGEKRARISQAIRKMNAPEPDGIPLL